MENKAEQIKKALECFHQRILNTDLAEKITMGEIMAVINAISLIKELTEENEKLTINMNAYGLTAKRLGEENERLRATGEWIPIPEYENKRCSVCRTVFSDFTLGYYCPKCGAKMKGE